MGEYNEQVEAVADSIGCNAVQNTLFTLYIITLYRVIYIVNIPNLLQCKASIENHVNSTAAFIFLFICVFSSNYAEWH